MDKNERIRRAQQAKKRKAAEEARREAAEKANVAAWLSHATRRVGEPLRRGTSAAERQHRHREAARELGTIPPPRHPRLREACRLDLLRFGLTYCFGPTRQIHHKPSVRMVTFVRALEETILNGGNRHVRWPRGHGKTTWLKVATIWALAYGHRRFVLFVAASRSLADTSTKEVWETLTDNPGILADFPEIAIPLADVAMTPQRARLQTYRGTRTAIEDNSRLGYRRLATLAGYANTGGLLSSRGADQHIRGLNIGSIRPDFIFIDDPQTGDESSAVLDKIEANIRDVILNLGVAEVRTAAVMASTPRRRDDISERFANRDRNPVWETNTETLVVKWGPEEWKNRYLDEKRISDEAARAFYLEHQAEIEEGCEMFDPSDGDRRIQVSAYQYALDKLFEIQEVAFFAEYQMQPEGSLGLYQISPTIVRERVNAVPYGIVPSACSRGLLAFCDVNREEGLRWEIAAFGPGRRVAVLAYGQYPAEGTPLFPEGLPPPAIPAYLAPALRTVAENIISARFRTEDGREMRVNGLCIDGGWQTSVVAGVVREVNDQHIGEFSKGWAARSRGFRCTDYSHAHHERAAAGEERFDVITGRKVKLLAAEECHTWPTAYGLMLAFNTCHWKEAAQTMFFPPALSPASASLYGSTPITHVRFAQEICGESLVSKKTNTKTGIVYEWKNVGANHFLDTHAGVMAYASIRGYFDPVGFTPDDGDTIPPPAPTHKKKVKYSYVRR